MVFQVKPKEDKNFKIKTCFAFLPKRIDDKIVWLQRYYKTWDWLYAGTWSDYVPNYYIDKEAAELHVQVKRKITV